jgi:23S rRNA (uracil1939-C5)-methyltransferase
MYEKVLDLAALTGTEKVFDLYCGIGTISLFLAAKAGEVIGVEVVPEAIKNAEENAERNGIKNTRFLVGKAEEIVPSMTEKADLVVVDPPRKGCDETLLSTIVRMDPQKIIYVSCNPATLARDLRTLCDSGFFVKEVWPYDQFPQTTHCEVVALITRQPRSEINP